MFTDQTGPSSAPRREPELYLVYHCIQGEQIYWFACTAVCTVRTILLHTHSSIVRSMRIDCTPNNVAPPRFISPVVLAWPKSNPVQSWDSLWRTEDRTISQEVRPERDGALPGHKDQSIAVQTGPNHWILGVNRPLRVKISNVESSGAD